MADHGSFRNSAVEAALWAVWRTVGGIAAALRPIGRALRGLTARVHRAYLRAEYAIGDILVDSLGRARARVPYLALGILALGNLGWLALQ